VKGTMNPEGARLVTYFMPTVSPPVHKYSSLCSTAHRGAAGQKGVLATVTAGHCTNPELSAMLWLAVTAVECTPTVYGN